MDAFVEQEFPEFRDVMASFHLPIQRFDFFRYLAVYQLGGFYLDLDIFLARNFEPLLQMPCVFSFEDLTIYEHLRTTLHMDWELANYAFGAAPRDPFVGAIINNCVRSVKEPEWIAPMMKGIPRWFRDDYYVLVTTG